MHEKLKLHHTFAIINFIFYIYETSNYSSLKIFFIGVLHVGRQRINSTILGKTVKFFNLKTVKIVTYLSSTCIFLVFHSYIYFITIGLKMQNETTRLSYVPS